MLFPRNSIISLLSSFKSGSLKCSQHMEEVIERSQKTSSMNHFSFQDPQKMLEEALQSDKRYKDGTNRPLEGIPIGVKDSINTVGAPTTVGTKAFLNHYPKYDA